MILKTKVEIFNWLKTYDSQFEKNISKNAYELIDIHEPNNQSLLNHLIQKAHLFSDYFEKLKSEGHQYIVNVKRNIKLFKKKLEFILYNFIVWVVILIILKIN